MSRATTREPRESIIAEAGASAGPIGVKVGAEFDNTGCLSPNGPEVRLGESPFANAAKFCRKALW